MRTRTALPAIAVCLFALACGDAAEPEACHDAGVVSQVDAGEEGCPHPMSQGPSEPCCLEHGIDACGAGLFCAAFDGRRQPTCYAERSRADRATCTADVQCASGSCNTAAKACRSMPGMECTAAIGCADGPLGKRYGCRAPGPATCEPIGDGEGGAFCVEDGDCIERHCVDYRCKAAIGSSCGDNDDCFAGWCTPCGLSNVSCKDSRHQKECLHECRDGSWVDFAVVCE
ncbi:MAG: hypothetical protein ACOX6T_06820 [Myxococcales bacterium]|jgi:hypothetical protein